MYRRKLRHSRVKNLYKFASFKTASAHTVESSLEFDACYHFEYSPHVKSFIAQPMGFTYSIHGKTNPYTPDFKIINNNQKIAFIEVKPHNKTLHSEFFQKFQAKKEAACQLGFELSLVTELQIRKYPVLNNFKLLHRYAGFQSHCELYDSVYGLVKMYSPVFLHEICALYDISFRPRVIRSLVSLIASGELKANILEKQIGDDLLLWV